MAVKDTLDKIVERHPDVIGAMVIHNGSIQHNLEAPYDILSIETLLETFDEIFEQTSMLEDEGYDFGELILDLANHSVIVRTIEGGLLAVLAPSLQRGQLVKLHVGLGMFGKAIEKAFHDEAPVEAPASEPEAAYLPEQPVVSAPAPRSLSHPVVHSEPVNDESSLSNSIFGRRRGGFRGTKEMIANRLDRGVDAVGEPTPKDEVSEEGVSEDGIPRHPDGTPKKMRKYRGQIFWE